MTRADAPFDELVGAAPPSAPRASEPEGSRLDDWWARVLSTPRRRRIWYWGGPILVTVIAAVLRLWHLGDPHTVVFDETFYVKDAYTLWHLGYEGSWPSSADASLAAGHPDVYTDDPSFVAHPPLGKWLIGLGLAGFGAQSSVGWRISTAVVGILAVLVVALLARMLTRSTVLATIAGGLMAVDGHAIVLSRISLLDNFVMVLTLLGVVAVLLDRRQSRARLDRWLARRRERGLSTDWGPTIWARPWLVTAGLIFGLSAGVKWNGVYFLAVFAVYTLVVDALARRRAGVAFWASGTLFRQAVPSFLLTVPVAVAAYLATWTGWFVTRGGYYRDWADQPGNAATGLLAWVPHALQSFWHYEQGVYAFNVGLSTPHPYAANPFGWLLLLRPTAFYYVGSTRGQNGCHYTDCANYITSLPNPLIWYAAVAALVYLVYRMIRYRQWQVGLVLTGVAAGYLPWLFYAGRTVFQFYAIVFEPYLIIGLTIAIGRILGSRRDPRSRRLSGIGVIVVFLTAAVLVSAFFYPVWTGMTVPTWFAQLHYWLPGWR